MAHIDLKNDLLGIRGPMAYSPETAKPLNELVEILLRDDNNSLSRGERELIGTYVSYLNDCFFVRMYMEHWLVIILIATYNRLMLLKTIFF